MCRLEVRGVGRLEEVVGVPAGGGLWGLGGPGGMGEWGHGVREGGLEWLIGWVRGNNSADKIR